MLTLTPEEQAILSGQSGPASALALEIVAETARLIGAASLIPIVSAHIDGCLYHGDSTTLFAERLVSLDAKVRVPTTLNVGALDLLHPERIRLAPHAADMARKLMAAYQAMGCRATWTCTPYQAGHRPEVGQHVAWGESNAVAFCNSVLGARTERYGDFLDIAAALCGRAPLAGLHLDENRRARLLIDATAIDPAVRRSDWFHPVLGAWIGREAGSAPPAILGLETATEDQLKALGAAAASTGAVGLFHVIGRTPEAPDLATAFGGVEPEQTLRFTPEALIAGRRALSTIDLKPGAPISAVGVGSPHLSATELDDLAAALAGRACRIPIYACTGRHVVKAREALIAALSAAGVIVIADTCIVATPILPPGDGVLMTNSGKFAHYGLGNTGYDVVFGDLAECVETAVAGRLVLGAAGSRA